MTSTACGNFTLRTARRAARGRRTDCQPGVCVESRPERGRSRRPGAKVVCLAPGWGNPGGGRWADPGDPQWLGRRGGHGSPLKSSNAGTSGPCRTLTRTRMASKRDSPGKSTRVWTRSPTWHPVGADGARPISARPQGSKRPRKTLTMPFLAASREVVPSLRSDLIDSF